MKKVLLVIMILITMVVATGCEELYTQADRVSHNVGMEADRFNVTRRLAVLNARTDKPIFELVGNFSLKNNSTNELEVICEVAPGEYKKHFVYLNQWTIYVVEDVSGATVSQYHYEVNFLPEMFVPYTFTTKD